MKFLKNNALLILLILISTLLLIALFNKDKLNTYLSEQMQNQSGQQVSGDVEKYIQASYNYQENKENYDFTFLEFSSTGCIKCKQMEPVLEEMRNSKKVRVKVEFIHILKEENQDIMKYYGISAVPMQVLLDKNGKEFYRHYGVIASAELEQIMLRHTASLNK